MSKPVVVDASKTCPKCGTSKPLTEFHKDSRRSDGRRTNCKVCVRQYVKEWQKQNPERNREIKRREYAKNRARYKVTARIGHLRRTYGITPEEYDARFESQGGRCANPACGKTPEENRGPLVVDHNHTTGAVRSLLCTGCNVGLGAVENPEFMVWAIAYLARHESEVA